MNADLVKPNKDFLKLLTDMGISEQIAEHALICTGNDSVEAAMTFLYDNPDVDYSELAVLSSSEQNDVPPSEGNVKSGEAAGMVPSEPNQEYEKEFKMVFVVNTSLNMGIGKIAAQVAHACLGLYNELLQKNESDLDIWLSEGEKKIVLKGVDHFHLKELQKKSGNNKLVAYMVQDAGRTQVPAGSCTVLAIFGEISAVDNVTGSLSLL